MLSLKHHVALCDPICRETYFGIPDDTWLPQLKSRSELKTLLRSGFHVVTIP